MSKISKIIITVLLCGYNLTVLAQPSIRDNFLVDKIIGNTDNRVIEYIYNDDDQLVKILHTGQMLEQGEIRPVKYVYVFEYENERVSKITH